MMFTLLASLLGVGGVAGAVLHFVGFAGVKRRIAKVSPQSWLILAGLAAAGAGLLYVDHRGYQRAKDQDEKRRLERVELARAIVTAIDGELDHKLAAISADTNNKLQTIDTEGRTIVQPIITRELTRDRTLADPGRCLTPGLLEAINAARGYLLDERLAGAAPRPADPPSVPAAGKSH